MNLRPLARPRALDPRLYGRTIPARQAAEQLADQGHHVHYVAATDVECITGHCAREAAEREAAEEAQR